MDIKNGKRTDIPQYDSPAIQRLWKAFETKRDLPTTNKQGHGYLKLRNFLFEKYLPFTLRTCRAYYNRTMPDNPSITLQDAESEACIALIQCIDRYKSEFGVRFEIYLRPRITGQIVDCLRTLQYFPRDVAEKRRKVGPRIQNLKHKLLKSNPTYEDYVDNYGDDEDSIALLDTLIDCCVFNQPIETIRKQESYVTPTRKYRVREQGVSSPELKSVIINTINRQIKDETERDSLVMYFCYGMNYKDIAMSLDCSISTVSSKVNSGREKLRIILRKSEELKQHLGFK